MSINRPWVDERISANGRSISDNFIDWFGSSKVKNSRSEPIVVYHGTNSDFDVFRNQYAKKTWEMFSDETTYANAFAQNGGGRLLPVYLSIQNPLDLSGAEGFGARTKFIQLLEKNGIEFNPYDIPLEYGLHHVVNMSGHNSELPEAIKRAGFDGIIMPDILEGMGQYNPLVANWDILNDGGGTDLRATTYVALYPTQIKSAIGNSGLYSKSNPSFVDAIEFAPTNSLAANLTSSLLRERVGSGAGSQAKRSLKI